MRTSLTDTSSAPPTSCPNSWFACGDGGCIEESRVCDFTPHCPHGEDEAGCRKTLERIQRKPCPRLILDYVLQPLLVTLMGGPAAGSS